MKLTPSSLHGFLRKRALYSQRYSHVTAYVTELERRSLLKNTYPTSLLTNWKEMISKLPPTLYAGFDPTADSLHIGNLLILLNLIRGAQFDCSPIALVGGYTALIGDPSGRKTARVSVHKEWIEKNSIAITKQIKKIGENCLKNTGRELIMVNNSEWYTGRNEETYLEIFEGHNVGKMLRMGPIKSRLSEQEDELPLKEFLYQTYQAFDWVQLADRFNCFFQIGGSDQLGHLDFGAHHIKRMREKTFAAGICLPLLTDKEGNKLGKSVGGGIWLSAEKTSPFHFYQFFRQLHDVEAADLLLKFSLKPFEEVMNVLEKHEQQLGKWIAQDALATELTLLVHGEEGLENAQRCSRILFKGSVHEARILSSEELLSLFGNPLKIEVSKINTMGDLADATRRDTQKGSILMTKGAFKVNGEKILDPLQKFDVALTVLPNAPGLFLISWGKRNFHLVQSI